MKNIMKIAFVLLGLLVGSSNAQSFDDFLNNLYSDLAPILALFGERVTMQFMSQALGFADCIALAMAPLGIITIMVSAIRVGGPTWLKAIVGRARENKAAAELEIMSSTSREVCELYNGENIVRCLGSGSVWQYVCLFQKGTGSGETEPKLPEIEFMAPDEAVSRGFFVLEDATGTVKQRIWKMLRRNVLPASLVSRQKQACVERAMGPTTTPPRSKVVIIHDDNPEAPNIALNLQRARRRTWIRIVACLGVFLQTGLLTFFCTMVYHKTFRLRFTKDDKPVPGFASPAACTGTALLMIAVFLCAHVVEKGTEEKTYHVDDKFKMHLYWLQSQQTVNDQVFESFSIEQGKPCSTFSISRREEKYRRKPWLENWQQIKAIAGVLLGLIGFVLQFVGLRYMNSYAALSQLAAVGLMTVCRAVVFPGFTTSFKPTKLVPHFELDWLAQKLGIEARLTSRKGAEDGKEEGNAGLEHCTFISWSIHPDREAGHRALMPLTGEMSRAPASEAQHILVMRRGLCRLAKVHTTSSRCAAKLATAMEKALEILFPNQPGVEEGPGFRWVIDVLVEGVAQQVWIDLSFENMAWKVPKDYLEALISLWAYTAEAEKEKQKTGQQRMDVGNIKPENDGRDRRKSSPKNLGPTCDDVSRRMDHVIRDLEAWAPQDHQALVIGEMQGTGVRRRLNHTRAPSHSQSRQFTDGPSAKTFERNGAGVDVYATRLLFSFMWSMAKALRSRIMGKVNFRYDVPRGPNEVRHPLWNDVLTRLAMTLAPASCLPEQDTVLEIVSSLSVAGKLPVPRPWFASMSTIIMQGYRSGDLYPFEAPIGHAKYLAEVYGKGPSGVGQRGAAWLLELVHGLTRVLKRFGQSDEVRRAQLQNLRKSLKSDIEGIIKTSMEPGFLEHMEEMYARQDRQIDSAFHSTEHRELPAHLEVTPLHIRAMDLDKSSYVPFNEEASLDAQDICHWSPLHWAAARGNVRLAESLLELGADTTLKDFGGFTAAHYACRSGCLGIVQLFNGKGVALAQAVDGTFPMHLAAEMGNLDVVEFLLKTYGRAVSYQSPRHELASTISRPRDFDGRIPVHYGAAGGHPQIVSLLKADINHQDDSGWTPLHVAVLAGRKCLVATLYGLSADGEVKDMRGRTPLVLACSEEKWEAIGELVKCGAKRNSRDSSGMTALHHLVKRGAGLAVILTLLEGLDVWDLRRLTRSPDQLGQTPLHLAARNGNLEIVSSFIQAMADADVTNDRGETPLFSGIYGAKTEDDCLRMIEVLVKGSTDLEGESVEGQSVIDLARCRGYDRVAEYLEAESDRLEREFVGT